RRVEVGPELRTCLIEEGGRHEALDDGAALATERVGDLLTAGSGGETGNWHRGVGYCAACRASRHFAPAGRSGLDGGVRVGHLIARDVRVCTVLSLYRGPGGLPRSRSRRVVLRRVARELRRDPKAREARAPGPFVFWSHDVTSTQGGTSDDLRAVRREH